MNTNRNKNTVTHNANQPLWINLCFNNSQKLFALVFNFLFNRITVSREKTRRKIVVSNTNNIRFIFNCANRKVNTIKLIDCFTGLFKFFTKQRKYSVYYENNTRNYAYNITQSKRSDTKYNANDDIYYNSDKCGIVLALILHIF